MARVVHFEIEAEDPERAIAFYENVFGWKFQKWEGPFDYWLIETGPEGEPGINGGLGPRPQGVTVSEEDAGRPATAFQCTLDVESVDDTTAAVREHGGSIVRPKSAVPGSF